MRRMFAALALLGVTSAVSAQTPLDTKTVELRHLKPAEAVKLLKPYIVSTGGGVFDVSEKLPIITIRDVPENIAKMERVLARYDHTPATIRLVFQLIEADTGPRLVSASNTRQLPVDLDSTLRSVLRFPNYRVIGQGVATAGEASWVTQQLASAGYGETYDLNAEIGLIRLGDNVSAPGSVGIGQVDSSATGTVTIKVTLTKTGNLIASRENVTRPHETIISTGLDVPLGHMVVLGTAATRTTGKALILTVKPELVRVK